MIREYLLTGILFFIMSAAYSQTVAVSGVVKNLETTRPVRGAYVTLQDKSDTSGGHTITTDSAGRFGFNAQQNASFSITITAIGFATVSKSISTDTTALNIGTIAMSRAADVLEGVTVTAKIPLAVVKGDTVQFNASQFKVNPDATAEDLAKKMPGITVENGQVKANGENVQKVTLDGRELFGDDATAALRNLPAEIIDKIQVFDRLSDQAQFTGVDDGNTSKGINIITKANMRNGRFGRIFGGYGTDKRYQAGGNTTILHENQKISLVGNFNNVNQQNFLSQDLLGVTAANSQRGGGGGRGGGGRGGGGGGNVSTGNFLVGQQNGINKTIAAGINYTDNWGKKLVMTGSYFYNSTENNTSQVTDRKYVLKGIPDYNQTTLSNSRNNNHRFSLRLEYKIDSANQLIITPNLGLQENTSYRNVTTSFFDSASAKSRTNNINNSSRSGNNFNSSVLYRHSFKKRGRTFSANLNSNTSYRNGDIYTDLTDSIFGGLADDSASRRYTSQESNGYQLSANLTYTEPLSKNTQLQASYNPSYNKNKADQEAYRYEESSDKYSVFDPRLSSKFDNTYKLQNAGLSYRYGTKDNQLSLGLNYQSSQLNSDQDFPRDLVVKKSFTNWLPNAMARFKLSERTNIRLTFRSNTNQPSVTQLQDVYDITNQPFVTAGNPALNQQVMNTINTRYTYTVAQKGILLVGNVFLQTAKNYITNATFVPLKDSALTQDITLKSGQQLTKPVNLNGYVSLRSFLNFAIPAKLIKSTLNFNFGVTYSKLPGIINNERNISKNTAYTGGFVVASNISPNVDFTASYSANVNRVTNQLQSSLDNNYFSHVASLQLNLLSKSGWFFLNDVTNQLYSGLSEGYNQNYFLWNISIGKKFLKGQKGELKLSVFDLLKQNRSITRNVTETYIDDVRNQVLQQYFMCTFTYNLRTFGAAVPANNRGMRRGGTPQM